VCGGDKNALNLKGGLAPQRRLMYEHCIANRDGHVFTHCRHCPSTLDAESRGRTQADVAPTGMQKRVPRADTSCLHREQHLTSTRPTWPRQIQHLDRAAHRPNAACAHRENLATGFSLARKFGDGGRRTISCDDAARARSAPQC